MVYNTVANLTDWIKIFLELIFSIILYPRFEQPCIRLINSEFFMYEKKIATYNETLYRYLAIAAISSVSPKWVHRHIAIMCIRREPWPWPRRRYSPSSLARSFPLKRNESARTVGVSAASVHYRSSTRCRRENECEARIIRIKQK